MYESHFGLAGLPFQLSPDATFFYGSQVHQRALDGLRAALANDCACVVVSGPIGAGKTTLMQALLGDPAFADTSVAKVVSTQLDAQEVLVAAASAFGLAPDAASAQETADGLKRLVQHLTALSARGSRALLVIDEAQNLKAAALAPLFELVRDCAAAQVALILCLVGQPELSVLLDAAEVAPWRDLISHRCELMALGTEETRAYVEFRLRNVGWEDSPSFDDDAFDEIHRRTRGIPRRINALCNRLLLARFLDGCTHIDVASVAQVARELHSEMGGRDAWADDDAHAARPVHYPIAAAPPQQPAPILALPRTTDGPMTLLCTAAHHGDFVQAAALACALAVRRPDMKLKLVYTQTNGALAYASALFSPQVHADTMALRVDGHDDDVRWSALGAAFGRILESEQPAAVIVFGGSGTALACATAAHDAGVPLVHIGAGARGGAAWAALDETARTVDQLADLLFTTDALASQALEAELIPASRIHCVGSLAVDTLRIANGERVWSALGFQGDRELHSSSAGPGKFALVIIENPLSLADTPAFMEMFAIVREVSRDIRVLWPVDQAVHELLRAQGLENKIGGRIKCLDAQQHADRVGLLQRATCVVTDVWHVQEQAAAFGVPCITIGKCFAQAATTGNGNNTLIGLERGQVSHLTLRAIFRGDKTRPPPPLWDGKSGLRIAGLLNVWLESCRVEVRTARPEPCDVEVEPG